MKVHDQNTIHNRPALALTVPSGANGVLDIGPEVDEVEKGDKVPLSHAFCGMYDQCRWKFCSILTAKTPHH